MHNLLARLDHEYFKIRGEIVNQLHTDDLDINELDYQFGNYVDDLPQIVWVHLEELEKIDYKQVPINK